VEWTRYTYIMAAGPGGCKIGGNPELRAGVLAQGEATRHVLASWALFHGAAMLFLDGQLELAGIVSGDAVAALVLPVLLDQAAAPLEEPARWLGGSPDLAIAAIQGRGHASHLGRLRERWPSLPLVVYRVGPDPEAPQEATPHSGPALSEATAATHDPSELLHRVLDVLERMRL